MSDNDLIKRGDALRIVDEDESAAFAYEQIRAIPAVQPTVSPDVAALVEAVKALREAADEAERTGTCLLPSGHFLSERCRDAILALVEKGKDE